MSDVVWVSHAPSDQTLSDGFMDSNLSAGGDQPLIELAQVARHGGAVPADRLPTEMWGKVGDYRAHHYPNQWPDISSYNGVWLISGKVADILGGFDLGDGVIVPVRLFAMDHATPVDGDWFVWNVGNVKEAFLPEKSTQIRPVPGKSYRTLQAADGDLKCSAAAKAGAAAWIDPKLRGTLFFGGELGQALITADLANDRAGFGTLLRCDVVDA